MRLQQLSRCALAVSLALVATGLAETKDAAAPADMVVFKDTVPSLGTFRASKLLNSEVYDPAGKDLGKAKDFVVNGSYDSVEYIVVDHGIVGFNVKLLALPYKAFAFGGPADDRVYVQVPLDVVLKAPGFDESKWPTEINADYYRSLDAYYNTHLGSAYSETQRLDQDEKAQLASGMVEPASLVWSRRATKLIGRDILSSSGEKLGSIKDLVVGTKSGELRYAVLSRGGGLTEVKYYAVPLSRFRINPDDKKLVLDITSAELKAIPSFDKDHWPAKPDPRWVTPATKVETK